MNILILGADGYYGYPLLQQLASEHVVKGIDNFSRRNNMYPNLLPYGDRKIEYCDITNLSSLLDIAKTFQPDIIIHLAEQRSAPLSMLSAEGTNYTLENNFLGTKNVLECAKIVNAKVIHIGSMGMYGYENGTFITEESNIRSPSSVYHLTKEIDSSLFRFYADTWNVDSVDLIQGTIWGIGGRFDYDSVYGTVINRFIVQSVLGHDLTVYGSGNQQRSFIHIDNSIDIIKEIIKNDFSGYSMYNQYTEILSVNQIANTIGGKKTHIENPRHESDNNVLESTNEKIISLGIISKKLCAQEINKIQRYIEPHANDINKTLIYPKGKWQ